MRTVAIFTTTRAEFGIFTPLIDAIAEDPTLDYRLFVGGSHLRKKYGFTIEEINECGYRIDGMFDYIGSNAEPKDLVLGLSRALTGLSEIFERHSFDFVTVVGDRYELLSIVAAAILYKRPIVHLHGGEITQMAIDEQVRHMITKAAHLHFASCERYARNIMGMGESSWRVHNTGALGVDAIKKTVKIPKEELFRMLGLSEKNPVALMTYHPVTLERDRPSRQQMKNLFAAFKGMPMQLVATAPNADSGREEIEAVILEKVQSCSDYHYIRSLGAKKYFSLIPHCAFVIGNSSSGMIEAPYFKIPTVNIGDRQKGRLRHESVIDTGYEISGIRNAIEKAMSNEFRTGLKRMNYQFGDGRSAERMTEILKTAPIGNALLQKLLGEDNFFSSAMSGPLTETAV